MLLLTVVVAILLSAIVFSVLKALLTGRIGPGSRYVSKHVLTQSEEVAYWRIKEACGSEKVVLAQVAFSSFIKMEKDDKESFAKFGRARQKVADFVICNKDFTVDAIIEVDDKTHNPIRDKARDGITEEAGIRTFRILANKIPSVNEFREALGYTRLDNS